MDINRNPTPNQPRPRRKNRLGSITIIVALLASMLAAAIGVSAAPAGAIVKGTEALLGDHPYQVALEDKEGQLCGGSLIDTDLVLTAAHCLDGLNPASLSIRAGSINLTGGQLIKVRSAVVHEKWGGENGDSSYDIALLSLVKPVTLNANVGLIDAESSAVVSAAAPGTAVAVSGWGALSENSEKEVAKLRHTNVKLINDATCSNRLRGDEIDNFSMICTVGTGNGACYGDSGGPLARQNNDGSWTQVGIVSWGTVCGSRQIAGIYSDLANLRTWITQNRSGAAPAPAAKPTPKPAPTPTPKPGNAHVDVVGNRDRIAIPAFGEAAPSFMTVETRGNVLVDVDVMLHGLSHQRVTDLDIIVVSPEGTEITLLSDAGGNRVFPSTAIRFDDAAGRLLPDSGAVRGRYLPTSNVADLPPADLAAFEGENPNGEWELYIFDAVRGKKGKVAGWTLVTETR